MHKPSSLGDAGFGSFFRYHGLLAPGIRLFRTISFPAKSVWVGVMLLIPIIYMLAQLWASMAEQVDTAQAERRGITFVIPALDLLSAAQNQRRAAIANAADLGEAQQMVAAAMTKLEAVQASMGSEFGTKAQFEAVRQAQASLAQTPTASSPDATFKAQTALPDAILKLIGAIADGSTLSLDPELDTYHLMNMSVLLGPQYQEQMGILRGLGFITLKANAAAGMPAERLQTLEYARALAKYLDENIENSYQRGAAPFPEVVKMLDMDGTDAARAPFLKAVDDGLLATPATGNAGEFLAAANTAINKQKEFDKKAIGRLDQQLLVRVSRVKWSFYTTLATSLFFIALAGYLMLSFYKVMAGGLREVAGHLEEITKGNLTTTPIPWGKDEAAQLMLTLGEMTDSLRNIVRSTIGNASSVNTASEEIASASQDLSRRTEASAAALEQTAATMTELAETVQRTSDTVAGAAGLGRDNAAVAKRGGAVIGQVVTTMQGINASSSKIADIISVIDGIAFQTNILALNAAVEAARAGEQGRGFAVVASEVRSLAGRSAQAAKEIKDLITASIEQVEKGGKIVSEAGVTIEEIVSNAGRIDLLLAEIALATREQSLGISQVGSAVHELDQNTQQNAALVEQTSAAAKALSDQAEALVEEVSFFALEPTPSRALMALGATMKRS